MARGFFDREALHLFPAARAEGGSGFDWRLLVDPESRSGAARLDAQYFRANVEPSDRYVQSVAGSSRYRLKAAGSGVANLVLTGDWIDCGFNAGCIESSVMAGLQCAEAVLAARDVAVGAARAAPPSAGTSIRSGGK